MNIIVSGPSCVTPSEFWMTTNELRWLNGVLQQKSQSNAGNVQWDDVPQVTEPSP